MALILIGFTSSAQSFSISPESLLLEDSIPVDGATTLQFDLANLTNAELALSWDLIEFDFPVEWNYNVCDYLDCLLPPLPAHRDMQFIPANQSSGVYMKLWVSPEGMAGDGIMRFHVYETNNMSIGDSITFNINASGFTGVLESSSKSIKVVPNPATDHFFLDGLQSLNLDKVDLTIIDLAGRGKTLNSNNADFIDVSSLDPGYYLLSISSENEVITKKVLIQ